MYLGLALCYRCSLFFLFFFYFCQKLLAQLLHCKEISSATVGGICRTALIEFLYKMRRDQRDKSDLTQSRDRATRQLYMRRVGRVWSQDRGLTLRCSAECSSADDSVGPGPRLHRVIERRKKEHQKREQFEIYYSHN